MENPYYFMELTDFTHCEIHNDIVTNEHQHSSPSLGLMSPTSFGKLSPNTHTSHGSDEALRRAVLSPGQNAQYVPQGWSIRIPYPAATGIGPG